MHNVLFSIVCIKRGGEAKTLYPSIGTSTYMNLTMSVER